MSNHHVPMIQKHLLVRIGKLSLHTDSQEKPTFVSVELDGDSDTSPNASASLQVPAAVWDDIRKIPAVLFDLADASDAGLRLKAAQLAERWEWAKRICRPHAAAYRALLEFSRAYDLPTNSKACYRKLCDQRHAQQSVRKALGQLSSRNGKETRPNKRNA